ncbi:DUF4870 domain-containing protein [Aporhodopirellula aestuarii]|uniref:DUF4870 domain-containing protein n=1 Tax=Aporhodopirellula aestuarii TaxID=2950107 RepID=A0ABT0UBW1_9BACT|nr:DUF4870 domain-containing protein [Aporhodopirellula aestuarii]MCM2374403.1 DUF4870 domain-containing protein [Aporhodopirellula aestuarii]
MSVASEIQRLTELRNQGALTEAEFQEAKAKVLAGQPYGYHQPDGFHQPYGFNVPSASANQMAMILHFSQYLGFIVPMLGFVAPILIWQLKKDEIPELDIHGRIVANWMLSSLLYSLISAVLIVVLIGILGLIIVGLLSLIYPIIGGIKANEGEPWDYPGSIRFF